MKKFNVTIVIVTFNSEKYIEKCIESISKSHLEKINYQLIIVDNLSNDKTINKLIDLKKKNNKIQILKNKTNVGFARAVNQGILKNTLNDFIILLNPDTVLEKDSLINLITCAEKTNSGICGGKTVDSAGHESGSYFRFPNLNVGIFDFTNLRKICKKDVWHKYFYYLDKKISREKYLNVDVVTGGYMLIKKSTFEKIGFLDDSFFMYLEDVDFCLRAKQSGINICHANNSKIIHIGGASSSNKDRIRHSSWLKSRKIYFLKHFGIVENIIIQPIFLLDDLFILSRLVFKK